MSSVKYYKPDLVTEKSLKIRDGGFVGKLPEKSDNGFIQIGLESDVVIQRISKDLYAHPSSGIRELYANEARACREAARHGANPRIVLTIDRDTRKIVIEGIDSSGMSWDVFSNVFCTLGRSTNFDGKESGQFGFGRAAYTCISDIMILETYCRETGEKYAVMGKSGIGFQTGLPEPDMEHFGTRITMTARDDVNMNSIIEMVSDCAFLSRVCTYINCDGYESSMQPAGTLEDEISVGNWKQGGILSIKDTDIDIAVSFTGHGGRGASYLCGIPIECEYGGEYYNHIYGIAVNIKDERKYRPTPDRERLSDNARKSITEKIDKMITDHLTEYVESNPNITFKEFTSGPEWKILQSMHRPYGSGGPVSVTDRIKKYCLMLSHYVGYYGSGSRQQLCEILRTGDDLLVTKSINERKANAVYRHDKRFHIIRPAKIDDFVSEGVETVDEYIRRNNINVEKPERQSKTRVYSRIDGSCETYDIESIPKGTIHVTRKEFDKIKSLEVKSLELDFTYGTSKALKDNKNTKSLSEWKESVKKKSFLTNKGEMTLGEIITYENPVVANNAPQLRTMDMRKVLRDDILVVIIDAYSYLEFALRIFDCGYEYLGFEHLANNDHIVIPDSLKRKTENVWHMLEYLSIMYSFKTRECREWFAEFDQIGRDISVEDVVRLEGLLIKKYKKEV